MDDKDNQAVTRLAMMLKERDNPVNYEISTAIVINENPLEFKTADGIFISKEYGNMTILQSILKGYRRKFLIDNITGVTETSQAHTHNLKANIVGEITWDDGPKVGDEYIVIPTAKGTMWYVFDKAVRL